MLIWDFLKCQCTIYPYLQILYLQIHLPAKIYFHAPPKSVPTLLSWSIADMFRMTKNIFESPDARVLNFRWNRVTVYLLISVLILQTSVLFSPFKIVSCFSYFMGLCFLFGFLLLGFFVLVFFLVILLIRLASHYNF